ncbi:uncharacterized protein UV8b_05235 [Ustilaginoidea virens]|uniref:Uncharacterized protein n=1 Tax=Ustilaginoidea virens TaxID=1159556 RepID=A0A8E5HSZ8_USTVR|nr:uncharacterized protein UV8b_05235 [Ustilaginoidea virens]QUC20994.1 hypothetical protein UV8b_05235 [Ustilaginoidea virens]
MQFASPNSITPNEFVEQFSPNFLVRSRLWFTQSSYDQLMQFVSGMTSSPALQRDFRSLQEPGLHRRHCLPKKWLQWRDCQAAFDPASQRYEGATI